MRATRLAFLLAILFVAAPARAITTSGTLTSDETWSGVVTLTGDVTVPSGITLTISPGTVVKATALSDDRSGGTSATRVELIIGGRLAVEGTSTSPITFTSTAAVPAKNDWYGIRFLTGADSTVTLKFLVVEWANQGISGDSQNAYPDVTDSTIRHVTNAGLRFSPGYNASSDPVKTAGVYSGNHFEDVGNGITLSVTGTSTGWRAMTWELSGNTVTGCTSTTTSALGVSVSDARDGTIRIDGNTVSSCLGPGVSAGASATIPEVNLANVEIVDNAITGGGTYGIFVGDYTKTRNGVVRGNTVAGSTYGIRAMASGSTLRIEGNVLGGTGYPGYGIYLYHGEVVRNEVHHFNYGIVVSGSQPGATALWNFVHDNTIGLQAEGTTFASFNRIEGSTTRAATCDEHGTDARRNWWGDVTTAEMNAEGYPSEISSLTDFADDSTRGRLDYRGWLPAPEAMPAVPTCRFVWPLPDTVTSRSVITLEGAADAPGGLALVEVSTDGGVNWTPVPGTSHWTASFAPPTAGPYALRCRATALDGTPDPDPGAATLVVDDTLPTSSGTLLLDETWSGTVNLDGDVVVPAGRILTVTPGTVVQALQVVDGTHSGNDPSRVEIIVSGDLVAQGTAESPVTFTSAAAVPALGDWIGLRYVGSSPPSAVTHAILEWAYTGLQALRLDGWPDVTDSLFRHMTSAAVVLQYGSPTHDPARATYRVSRNTVEDVLAGIVMTPGRPTVGWETVRFEATENDVTCGTGYHGYTGGVSVNAASGPLGTVLVARNRTASCNVSATAFTTSRSGGTVVEDNVVTLSDISVEAVGSVSVPVIVRRNEVNGSLRANEGVDLRADRNYLTGGGVSFWHGLLTRNAITGCGASVPGVRVSEPTFNTWDPAVLLYNDIHDNAGWGITGFRFRGHWNRVEANASGAIQQTANRYIPVDFRRNWWGPALTSEIIAAGYPANLAALDDIEDDPTKGRIDYSFPLMAAEPSPQVLESRFVWPLGGSALPQTHLIVEGTSWGPDGVARVEVSSDGGATWRPATGTSVWTYTFDPPSPGPFTLLCRAVGPTEGVEDSPDVVSFTVDTALPTTSGSLLRDETWPAEVNLTGDVTVPAGRTLTLPPGTTVRALRLADDRRSGLDLSRIEIIVEGRLAADGGAVGRIGLTSAASTPAQGDWYGLRFSGPSVASESLRGVDVSWVVSGISSQTTASGSRSPDLSDCTASHASSSGVFYSIGPGVLKPKVTVSRCTIGDIGHTGLNIDVSGSAPFEGVVEDSSVSVASGGAGGGINIMGGSGTTVTARVIGNSVTCPSRSGNCIGVGSYYVPAAVVVENNTVSLSGTGGYGIYAGATSAVVRGNVVSGGGGTGIRVQGSPGYTVIDAEVASNLVTGGATAGLAVYGTLGSRIRLHDNTVRNGTQTGLGLQSADQGVRRNNLYGAGTYDLVVSNIPVDASGNWWGATTTAEMQSEGCTSNIQKIWDQRDSSSYGLVTYCPFALGPFGDQAVISMGRTSSGYEIRWNPKPSTTYDVIRGELAGLSMSGGVVHLGAVTCEAQAVAFSPLPDPSPTPAPGSGWFFLLRDHTVPGAYGYGTNDAPEVPDSGACP